MSKTKSMIIVLIALLVTFGAGYSAGSRESSNALQSCANLVALGQTLMLEMSAFLPNEIVEATPDLQDLFNDFDKNGQQ